MAQLLDTTPQTVSRWKTGQASPQPRSLERLLALDWLVELLGQLYEPDEARLWLFSPNRDLAGRRPADLLAEDRTPDVLRLVDVLQTGAYR